MAASNTEGTPILICVLAHNEECLIGACLDSLPLGDPSIAVAVVVNGSTDGTAAIVRRYESRGVRLVEYSEGGKARSWNRFMLDEAPRAETFVFVDGDARLLPGSVEALARCLRDHPGANAAAGMPRNGRRAAEYRQLLCKDGGLFGDLYALSGAFVERLRASGLRLPEDLVGDDSLIGALAHTDLGGDADWDDARVIACEGAGFLCEPNTIHPASLRMQSKRMVSYAVRHFQNRMISAIMRETGPHDIPSRMADIYEAWLPRLRPRLSPVWYWFDRRALARMRAAAVRARARGS
ncbi:glycosyltransferase family A protein [Qipengyuania spongiae]|uniref:Glycosyltransferase family 2 protein n=1 Tax=Qipengyuania spongiae TaxID=2909673 RepID=A0ABY5SZ33_9SPHN|nr:glycosyltransferase family A protein [Qipengyuania spongiae]UVI39455.1 glycosyltransferase family 2 protein [Qipengyuania spongiae]